MNVRHGAAVDNDIALDLALAHVTDAGVGTLSLTTLAERAGVSRATFYRMFNGRADLIAQLARREMQLMVAAGMTQLDLAKPTGELAGDLVSFALGYLRGHRGLCGVRDREPEVLLTYLIAHGGSEVNLIELVTSYVEPVLADPRHRTRLATSPRQAAEHLVRIVLSHFLAESRSIDDAALASMASRAVCR